MDKVFVDSDIILDLLARREPFLKPAASLFSMAERGKIKAHVSPLIFSNLYYILRKLTSNVKAKDALKKLKMLVAVLPIDEKIIDLALSSGFNDFEDAVQYYAALENNISCLITRNKKDYKRAEITVCTAEEFVNSKRIKAG